MGSIPGWETYKKQPIEVFLSHQCFSLSPPSLSLFLSLSFSLSLSLSLSPSPISTALELILDLCFSKLQLSKRWAWFTWRTGVLIMEKATSGCCPVLLWGQTWVSEQGYPGEEEQMDRWTPATSEA